MNWSRRYQQWLEVLRRERRSGGRVPWFTMIFAILSGPVPRAVWRSRMRTCRTCPLYSDFQMPGTTKRTDRAGICRSVHPALRGIGCGCLVAFTGLTANPYGSGCFGRTIDPELGWREYVITSRLRAVVDFILGR